MSDSREIAEWFLLVTGEMKNGKPYVNIVGGYPTQKDGKNASRRLRTTTNFEFHRKTNKLVLHVRPLYASTPEI